MSGFLVGRWWPTRNQRDVDFKISKQSMGGTGDNFFAEQVTGRDGIIWATLLSKARICNECSNFKEYKNTESLLFRPVVVSIKKSDTLVYNMVLAIKGKINRGGAIKENIWPTMVYYIVKKDKGEIVRVDAQYKAELTNGSEWRIISNLESDIYYREVQSVFWNEAVIQISSSSLRK